MKTATLACWMASLSIVALSAAPQGRFQHETYRGEVTIKRYSGADETLSIPDTIDGLPVTDLGNLVLSSCRNLTEVTIGKGVTRIGSHAFGFRDRLTSVTVPDGVTHIADGTFNQCAELTTITVPARVAIVGEEAFKSCFGPTEIHFRGDAPCLNSKAFDGTRKTSVSCLPRTTGWDATFGHLLAAARSPSPEPEN